MAGAVKLNTTGGGSVVVQPASSIASDVTVNVPSVNGTLVSTGSTAQVSQAMLAANVAGNGPAFSAQKTSAQSTGSGTSTKIQYNTEIFDTNNCYDQTTNYRFTPTVAGYYQINISIRSNNAGAGEFVSILMKNGGSSVYQGSNAATTSVTINISAGASLVYLNGTTDYVEGYIYTTTACTISDGYFSASLARAA